MEESGEGRRRTRGWDRQEARGEVGGREGREEWSGEKGAESQTASKDNTLTCTANNICCAFCHRAFLVCEISATSTPPSHSQYTTLPFTKTS